MSKCNTMLLSLTLLLSPAVGQYAQAGELDLTAEQWEVARNAERLVAMPVIRAIVKQWSSAQDKMIEIQYPGGEEGELWVNELKSWLVALGVPSAYQVAVPGSGQDDLIRFKLINGGEQFQ